MTQCTIKRFRATSSCCCSVKLVIVFPPFKRPNADCPKEQRLCNRGELPHRTSRQKTCQYVPAGHLVPVWPGARCRPPIFPCAGSAADAPAPGEPGFVCAGDPHRPVCPVMGTHIGITSRPAITEIDIFALGTAVTAIDCAGGAKRGVSMAIRALDMFLLRHKNHHLQMRIDDGAKASFSVKKQC